MTLETLESLLLIDLIKSMGRGHSLVISKQIFQNGVTLSILNSTPIDLARLLIRSSNLLNLLDILLQSQ